MEERREERKTDEICQKQGEDASGSAQAFFREGYNCCQSVFLAFADRYGFDRVTACRLSASFGGGVGRLREICGAVSAMALVCGLECGATEGSDREGKAANYEQMQRLAARFQERSGSLICRELLGLNAEAADKQTNIQTDSRTDLQTNGSESVVQNGETIIGGMGNFRPQERTEQYYAARPCERLVGLAAEILEQWLAERSNR